MSQGRMHPLDDPVLSSLSGTHTPLGRGLGRVRTYAGEVSGWTALPADVSSGDWADLAELAGPGQELGFMGPGVEPPAGWTRVFGLDGVQMTGENLPGVLDPEACRLGPADVPEMLDLVARTRPGPFRKRTIEMGAYLGIRHEGRLVAMAGERLRPAGWTEISAVCTDPGHRGKGLAARLMRALAVGIRERGEQPLLHAAAENVGAIRLYESLGFRLRRSIRFDVLLVPEA